MKIIFIINILFTIWASDTTYSCISDLDGQDVCIEDFEKDDIVILSFWATWCKPCLLELDEMNEILSENDETKVAFYAVSIDEPRTINKVHYVVNLKDWEFDILIDEEQKWKRYFNVQNVPTLLILKKGIVEKRIEGYSPNLYSEIENFIDFE